VRTLASALSLHKPASRRLGAAAVLLLVSGLAHLLFLLAVSGDWTGPVSLRKPITFGLSVGMLLWTVGWVIDRLPSRSRLEKSLGLGMVLSGLTEVALISVQAWRGVPSHFNYTTVEDLVVFVSMGVSIAVLSVGLLITTVWTFAARLADGTVALAVRAGMVLVLTGLGIGQWIIELGNDFIERYDLVPDRVLSGEAGVPTFPHAMGFHGIQVFIVAVLITGLVGLNAHAARRVLRLLVAGYSALLGWAVLQAASGRAPSDVLWSGGGLAVLGVALLAAAAWQLVVGWRRSESRNVPALAVCQQTARVGAGVEGKPAVPSAL